MDVVGKGIPDQRNTLSRTCVHPEKVLRVHLGLARPHCAGSASPAFSEVYTSYPDSDVDGHGEVELKGELT